MTREELALAHRLLIKYVKRFGPSRVRKHYRLNISPGTVTNLAKGRSLTGKAEETKDALEQFFSQVISEAIDEIGYYHLLKPLLQCGDQGLAQKYIGTYYAYRFQSGFETLLVGGINVAFDEKSASYTFTHKTVDSSLDVSVQQIEHTGPFYVFENRVYLVGIGLDAYGTYLRPIIVQATERPKTVPLRGVVLTEYATDHVPVAARTVLYHEELHASMLTKHPNEEDFKSIIVNQLRLPSHSEGEPVRATNLMGW